MKMTIYACKTCHVEFTMAGEPKAGFLLCPDFNCRRDVIAVYPGPLGPGWSIKVGRDKGMVEGLSKEMLERYLEPEGDVTGDQTVGHPPS